MGPELRVTVEVVGTGKQFVSTGPLNTHTSHWTGTLEQLIERLKGSSAIEPYAFEEVEGDQ